MITRIKLHFHEETAQEDAKRVEKIAMGTAGYTAVTDQVDHGRFEVTIFRLSPAAGRPDWTGTKFVQDVLKMIRKAKV